MLSIFFLNFVKRDLTTFKFLLTEMKDFDFILQLLVCWKCCHRNIKNVQDFICITKDMSIIFIPSCANVQLAKDFASTRMIFTTVRDSIVFNDLPSDNKNRITRIGYGDLSHRKVWDNYIYEVYKRQTLPSCSWIIN